MLLGDTMDNDVRERLSELYEVLQNSKDQPGHSARVRYALNSLDRTMAVVSGGALLPSGGGGTSSVQASSYQISLTGTCPHCNNAVTLTAP